MYFKVTRGILLKRRANNWDRRVMLNSMGPFWDGNEVWLITAGGVTFAAFPKAYAVMFSGLYTPLMKRTLWGVHINTDFISTKMLIRLRRCI